MKLTTKSEYSLLALIYIARHGGEGFVKVEDICSEYHLSKKYLEQFLFILKQNRYLKAKRGAGGGYQLSKPAEEISIAEIVRLMDGPIAPTESVSEYFFAHTALEREKKITGVFLEIRNYVANKLASVKLSDIV